MARRLRQDADFWGRILVAADMSIEDQAILSSRSFAAQNPGHLRQPEFITEEYQLKTPGFFVLLIGMSLESRPAPRREATEEVLRNFLGVFENSGDCEIPFGSLGLFSGEILGGRTCIRDGADGDASHCVCMQAALAYGVGQLAQARADAVAQVAKQLYLSQEKCPDCYAYFKRLVVATAE